MTGRPPNARVAVGLDVERFRDLIVTAIAVHRRFDKHNPQAYAELTVRKAAQSLEAETDRQDPPPSLRR